MAGEREASRAGARSVLSKIFKKLPGGVMSTVFPYLYSGAIKKTTTWNEAKIVCPSPLLARSSRLLTTTPTSSWPPSSIS